MILANQEQQEAICSSLEVKQIASCCLRPKRLLLAKRHSSLCLEVLVQTKSELALTSSRLTRIWREILGGGRLGTTPFSSESPGSRQRSYSTIELDQRASEERGKALLGLAQSRIASLPGSK